MRSLKNLVTVGHSGKPHGTGGEINIIFDYDSPAPFTSGNATDDNSDHSVFMIFTIDGVKIPFRMVSLRSRGVEGGIVALKGIHTAADASQLVNKDVMMTAADAACLWPDIDFCSEDGVDSDISDGDFYLEDLVGFHALNDNGEEIAELGVIKAYDDSTQNVLLVISAPDGREILIPAVDDFIDNIDADKHEITFCAPREIIDINL